MKMHLPTYKLFFCILLTLLCLTNLPATAQKIIKINGKVQYMNSGIFERYNYVWIKKGLLGSEKAIDSVKISPDGSYALTLNVSKPGYYRLDIVKWQSLTFWADESLSVSSRGYDTAQVKVKNSGFVKMESNSATNRFISILNFRRNQEQTLLNDMVMEGFSAQKYRSTDSTWYDYLRGHNLYKKLATQSEAALQFTYTNTNDPVSKLYMLSLMNQTANATLIQNELNKIIAQKPDFEDAIAMKKTVNGYLETVRKTQAGSIIPDIAYPDINKKVLDIKSLRGKYLIVDFWASWCGPCRKSIPKLKHLYEQYHDKGFDIMSISIDTDNAAWKKAMDEEAMPWHQVLSPDKDKTMADFNIKGVPTLFIVAPDGRIVEKFTGYSSQVDEILQTKLGSK